ncbi:MAG: hypothetical protein WDO13_03030 [Verrucomicrobiota bacterium]
MEGHDLFDKGVDVVVCDGFVGNVTLKSCERLAKAISNWLRSELKQNLVRTFGAVLGARRVLLHPPPHQHRGIRRLAAARRERHLHQGARQLLAQGPSATPSASRGKP